MNPKDTLMRPVPTRMPEPIEKQRILCTKEVAAYLGVCKVTAARIMRESGRAMRIGNRLLIQERYLREYLRGLEGRL